jgi:hypothetical protein
VRNSAGQRDHTIVGGDPDMRGVDARLPREFSEYCFLKLTVLRV